MPPVTKLSRIDGFTDTRKDDKTGTTVTYTNGPHHDAKWAKDILGTNFTARQRKNRVLAASFPLPGARVVRTVDNT